MIKSDSKIIFHLNYKTDKCFLPVNLSIDDIAKILQNLDHNKAHSNDKIGFRMLELCINSICDPLGFIFKQFIERGPFSSEWKKGMSVEGQGLLAPGGYLDLWAPSPNTYSWVKIKQFVNPFSGSMTKKRGIITDNIQFSDQLSYYLSS